MPPLVFAHRIASGGNGCVVSETTIQPPVCGQVHAEQVGDVIRPLSGIRLADALRQILPAADQEFLGDHASRIPSAGCQMLGADPADEALPFLQLDGLGQVGQHGIQTRAIAADGIQQGRLVVCVSGTAIRTLQERYTLSAGLTVGQRPWRTETVPVQMSDEPAHYLQEVPLRWAGRAKAFEDAFKAMVRFMIEVNDDPTVAYAIDKTDRMVSEENAELLSDEDLAEWADACEEFEAMSPDERQTWIDQVLKTYPKIDELPDPDTYNDIN